MTQTEFKNLIENWAAKHKLIKHGNKPNRKSFLCLEASNDSRAIVIDVEAYLKSKRTTIDYPCVLLVPYSSKVDDTNTQSASKNNMATVFILTKKLQTEDADVKLTQTESLANALLSYLNEYAYRASDNAAINPLFINIDECELSPIKLDEEKGIRLDIQFMTPFEPDLQFDADDYEGDLFN
jgi:hypothetical protein